VIKITKFKKRSEIVDKKRINLMLKNLVQKGKKLKVESFIVVNLWKAMINSFIKLERRKI
jgi:Chorismate mutase type II.